jgi:hypothetical protein
MESQSIPDNSIYDIKFHPSLEIARLQRCSIEYMPYGQEGRQVLTAVPKMELQKRKRKLLMQNQT